MNIVREFVNKVDHVLCAVITHENKSQGVSTPSLLTQYN